MLNLPPVVVKPYDDQLAMAVLSMLDPMDHIEAEKARGKRVKHLELFADWRAQEPLRVVSLVICAGTEAVSKPFAVLGLSQTGQAGVAAAALLARNHRRFRRELYAACLLINEQMPVFCEERGIHRIEARSWADHPRAGLFLRACGFAHEADMPGFGADGTTVFRQFAWTPPTFEKETNHVPS